MKCVMHLILTLTTTETTMTNINKITAPAMTDQVKDDTTYANELLVRLTTKSAVIRYLTAEGWKKGRIAKAMNIRFQHVRNVIVKPLKKVVAVEMTASDLGQ